MPATFKKSGPGISGLKMSLQQLRRADVLVGIPSTSAKRKKKDPLNNAELMFLLTNGSALRGIPATPIIEPGVERTQKLFTPHLGLAAKAILDKNPELARQELEIAGTIAENGVKRMFTANDTGWPPNKPSTIKRKGSDRRNIDTGALRAAVTHVVRVDKPE